LRREENVDNGGAETDPDVFKEAEELRGIFPEWGVIGPPSVDSVATDLLNVDESDEAVRGE
jgi:hypothetical protein